MSGKRWLPYLLPPVVFFAIFMLARFSKTQHPLFATREDVAATRKLWQSNDTTSFIEIDDVRAVRERIAYLLSKAPLTGGQRLSAEETAINILHSLKTGNWDDFKTVRFPVSPDPATDEYIKAFKKFTTLTSERSHSPMDYYKDIWKNTFRGKALWKKISMNATNSFIFEHRTNSIGDDYFEVPESSDKQHFYVRSHVHVPFKYSTLQQEEIEKYGSLMLWHWFFFSECPQPDGIRPFKLVFFWSTDHGVWVPIQFSHEFLRNPAITFRFF